MDTIAVSPLVIGVAIGLAISALMWIALQASRISELRRALQVRESGVFQLQQDLAGARQECARVAAELGAFRQTSAEKLAMLQSAETKLRSAATRRTMSSRAEETPRCCS